LLLAPDLPCELRRLAITDGCRKGFDRRVGGDFLSLFGVLGLGVLEQLLLGTGAAKRVDRPLEGRGCTSDHSLDGLGGAAELLDLLLDLPGVRLGLAQMRLEALLIGGA